MPGTCIPALAHLTLAAAMLHTIASGVISVSDKESSLMIGTEAAASSDNLDAISGGHIGQLLLVTPSVDGKAVVLVHGSTADGQLLCPGGQNLTLATTADCALLFYTENGWVVLAHSLTTDPQVSELAAIVAENTDVLIPMDFIGQFFAVAGTWTPSRPATGQYRLRRTAAAAAHDLALRAYPRSRSSADKGVKVRGVKIAYAVGTADVNDVTVSATYQVLPATGAAPGAAVSFGTITYDAAHDTTAERKAVGSHTMTITFGTPVYLPADIACVEIVVNVDGTASGVFDIVGAELICSETLVDAS